MRSTSDELKAIFSLIYNENENERNNAASALYRAMLRLSLHPSSIYIGPIDAVYGEQIEAYHRKRLTEMMRENDFFRRHVDPALIKQAENVGDIEYRWYEFDRLIRDKLTGDPDDGRPLSRGWQAKVKDVLDIGQTQLNRWQQGLDLIPERAFTILNEMASVPEIVAISGKVEKPRRGRKPQQEVIEPDSPVAKSKFAGKGVRECYYDWLQPGVYDILKSHFENGASVRDIYVKINSEGFNPIHENQVTQAIHNGVPKNLQPKLSQEVYPPDSSKSISWLEVWMIGGSMFGKTWTPKVMLEIGMPMDTRPPTALVASADKVRSLRQKYQDLLTEKERIRLAKLDKDYKSMMARPTHKTEFLDVIVEAGPQGMTIKEATEKLGWTGHHVSGNHGRVGDLARQFLIFKIGEQPGRDGDVWVSTQYGEHYPQEFALAKAAYDQLRH
jgi:hypothetical protein